MIPEQYHGKPPSSCQSEILAALIDSDGESAISIRRLIHYRYCKRTVLIYLKALRDAGKVECYVADDMRKPIYRLVKR